MEYDVHFMYNQIPPCLLFASPLENLKININKSCFDGEHGCIVAMHQAVKPPSYLGGGVLSPEGLQRRYPQTSKRKIKTQDI